VYESESTRALLDIEDACADVLFAKIPHSDALLWPLARWPVNLALQSQHLKFEPVRSKPLNRIQRRRLDVGRQLPNRASSDRLTTPVENLFIVSGTTRVAMPRRTGNWLVDDFAEALGDRAAVVQNAPLHPLTSRSARPANKRTWTWDPANTRVGQAALRQPLAADDRDEVERLLKEMLKPVAPLIGDDRQDQIVKRVVARAHRVKYEEAEFGDLLDRVQPRRILMQTAAYGDRSHLIRLAHQRGIQVIELQHGWVGGSHAAYNFGRAMTGTNLTDGLPDTLFTFGDYWGQDLRFPGRIVSVGKPALNRTVEHAAPFHERAQRLLLVSSVHDRERLNAIAGLLRGVLPPSWEIALRPHPSERTSATDLFSQALTSGVVLDQATEVSASIASSRAVLGFFSTVLYEALPCGTHIGVIDSDLSQLYTDAELFPQRLSDDASYIAFAERIQSDVAPSMRANDHVWKPRAVETFLSLLA